MENKWNHLFIHEAQVTNIPFLRGKNTVRIRMHRQRRVLGRVKLELNVTALFYLEDSRRIQGLKRREWRSAWGGREREGERERERKRERKRERASACTRERESVRKRFGSSFCMFFFSTWACPMQIGLSQECCLFCLFCLKSSLWSSDLPCLLATAILDSFPLFYLPNTLEEDMATHSSILAWRIPWTELTWWAVVQWVTKSQT